MGFTFNSPFIFYALYNLFIFVMPSHQLFFSSTLTGELATFRIEGVRGSTPGLSRVVVHLCINSPCRRKNIKTPSLSKRVQIDIYTILRRHKEIDSFAIWLISFSI